MSQHIKVVAVLNIIYHSIGVIVGILLFGLFSGIGILSGNAEAAGIMTILAFVFATLISITSLPGLISGIALLRYKAWARIVLMVVSGFNLFQFPFGTALGGYSFWVLINDETRELIEQAEEDDLLYTV